MRQSVLGTFHGIDAGVQPGDIVEVGDEAERYIRVGLAEALGEERAVPDDDDVEAAVPKRGPGRPKKAP
jgi:hypothetical protein